MFFDQETVAFRILDVFEVRQQNGKVYNAERGFDALSFRREADTVIRTRQGEHRLCDGSVAFFPAKVNYTRETKRDDLIVVHFHALYHAMEIECLYPGDPQPYRALFEELLACWRQKAPAYRHTCSALLYQILALCYRERQPRATVGSKIQSSIDYIEENCLAQDFSLTEAAHRSFMSEVYFRRLFRAQYHVSPKRYVLQKRMRYATSLLGTGYYAVREVAAMCGYRDEKYFSVEFKRMMGVSPSRYAYTGADGTYIEEADLYT